MKVAGTELFHLPNKQGVYELWHHSGKIPPNNSTEQSVKIPHLVIFQRNMARSLSEEYGKVCLQTQPEQSEPPEEAQNPIND